MMWWPIAIAPSGGRGHRRRVHERLAKTFLPVASSAIVNRLQGTYLHLRGVRQSPAGGETSFTTQSRSAGVRSGAGGMVGGMGLFAAVLRRER